MDADAFHRRAPINHPDRVRHYRVHRDRDRYFHRLGANGEILMPVGFRVIEQVAGLLSETEARLVSELAPAVGKTPRAVRYALNLLMGAGRARREGGLYFACAAAPRVSAAKEEAA
jgi:hypothetical protein